VTDVSIRDLRNHGGDILDDVSRGAIVTVTRQGRPIAELRPIRRGTDTARLLELWRGTPTFSLEALRADLAAVLDDAP
jgi:prevent-host-death family protein